MQFNCFASFCRAAFWTVCLMVLAVPVHAAVSSGVSFLSDFEVDAQRGRWAYIEVMALNRLIASGAMTNHRKAVAVVDVRPGDNPMSCCIGTERAEVAHMRAAAGGVLYESAESGTQYFALSYKFPTDFKTIALNTPKAFQILLQLHGPDSLGSSPALALDIKGGRFALRTNGGDLAQGNHFVERTFFDSSLNPGYWTDLVMRIKFAADDTGSVTIWRRNESETRFREVLHLDGIATLQYHSIRKIEPTRHYWKQGLYRSSAAFRNILWMGPIARANSFAAAERAAFNTKSGMPR
ncbi:MAG: hypothetical protein GEV05_25485 [Betaproteobacteria bacterium]|nr:hypothetical protein [Betaproteobacteria bacterium]